jgi:hypothetical protein
MTDLPESAPAGEVLEPARPGPGAGLPRRRQPSRSIHQERWPIDQGLTDQSAARYLGIRSRSLTPVGHDGSGI